MTRTPSNVPGGYRETLEVAWPLIVSMGSFTLMQFADRLFLAWHSAVSIQAALPAGILAFTLISGFVALAGYANTFVAQYHGAGDPRGCSRATAQGLWLALLSWPLILLLIPVGWGILRLSGHEPRVLAEEHAYFTIVMLGGVASPLGAAISSFFSGRGDTRTTMFTNLLGHVANVALDYALIFGRWGFPALGIRGAAWATVIAGFVSPVLLFLLYWRRPYAEAFGTRAELRFDSALFRRMIRFGTPAAVHLVLDVGAFTLFVLLTGRLDAISFAASNIALSINNVAFMPLIGMGIAASILVGRYQGQRRSDLAERAAWSSLKLGWLYMAVVGISFAAWPEAYLKLFAARGQEELPASALVPVGRQLLLMMAIWGLFDAANLIIGGALKGAGDTRFVMIYSLAMAWGVWIPAEWIVFQSPRRGIIPAWIVMTAYVFLLAAGFFWRFLRGTWRRIELIEPLRPLEPSRPAPEALMTGD